MLVSTVSPSAVAVRCGERLDRRHQAELVERRRPQLGDQAAQSDADLRPSAWATASSPLPRVRPAGPRSADEQQHRGAERLKRLVVELAGPSRRSRSEASMLWRSRSAATDRAVLMAFAAADGECLEQAHILAADPAPPGSAATRARTTCSERRAEEQRRLAGE